MRVRLLNFARGSLTRRPSLLDRPLRSLGSAPTRDGSWERRSDIVGGMLLSLIMTSALSLSSSGFPAAQLGASQQEGQAPPQARAFLEALKKAAPPASGAFDIRRAGKLNVERVLELMAPGGVSFADVNGVAVGHASLVRLSRDLKSRRGRFYRALIHLGYVYSRRFPRDSSVSVQRTPSDVRVTLPAWYTIVLRPAHDGLRVTSVEYLQRQRP